MPCKLILFSILSVATAFSSQHDQGFKIMGGENTTITKYPFAAVVLAIYETVVVGYACSGTVISNKAILTVAHCIAKHSPTIQWKVRLGSANYDSGGTVYNVESVIFHPSYDNKTYNMDFAILRVKGTIVFGDNVAAAAIAPANYNVPDDQPVWAIGYGQTKVSDLLRVDSALPDRKVLRHVQIKTVNHQMCAENYAKIGINVTNDMICSGLVDIGGKDQCTGDSGGPLIYNNVVVGVCSFGRSCGIPDYPGVNARVASASQWIMSNAN